MWQKLPKRGVNRQLQAKTPKYINRNISGTINPTNKQFEDRVQTMKGTSWVVRHYSKANTTWLAADIFRQWMFRFGPDSATGCRITCRLRRNGRDRNRKYNSNMADVCFLNGSSHISAVNWDMSTKFGLLIDFDLLKAATSTNTKPEVVFSSLGRHLDKWI